MSIQKEDKVEVLESSTWMDGVVIKVRSDMITVRLNLQGHPVTQRKVTEEGNTWRYR